MFCLFLFSILNKLTPEKFDKLCLELLNVGVESKLILKGVILLVRWWWFVGCFFGVGGEVNVLLVFKLLLPCIISIEVDVTDEREK